jgi:rSAM/selenodomain-associated transferase 1
VSVDKKRPKMKNAIGLLFRLPQKGKVKTRLAKQIGADDALYYYTLMLDKVIFLCKSIKEVELIGFYKGYGENLNFDFPLIKQKGNNLGQIISNVIKDLKSLGYQKLIIIGSDSPDIPKYFFDDAIRSLDDFEYVIGPTEDGGFYMFGCICYYKGLFNGIKWGTNYVFNTLLSNIKKQGRSYKILPLWYDIDDKMSLDRWLNSQSIND